MAYGLKEGALMEGEVSEITDGAHDIFVYPSYDDGKLAFDIQADNIAGVVMTLGHDVVVLLAREQVALAEMVARRAKYGWVEVWRFCGPEAE
jgi:hypothetical protein